jgi:hypothetical protein
MYASDLRAYGLSAVVAVLLGAGTGLGWHYLADSAGGKAVAAAATPLAQQDAPNPPPASPPAPAERLVLDAPPFPGLSHYPQPALPNPPKECAKGHACGKHRPYR